MRAFINSKLDFCNSLLYGLPKYDINKLQSVQKFLSKTIEKVAAMRLTDCLCGNNLNESLQTTFKKHHSLRVQNDILKSIDNKQCVVLLLLDLSAVFDTVDHKILLQRLRSRLGTRGKALAWLQSYLTDRS